MNTINNRLWINRPGHQVNNHLYIICHLVMAVRLFCRKLRIIRRKLRRFRFSKIRRSRRSNGLIWKLGLIFFMGLILSLRLFRHFWLIFRLFRLFKRSLRKLRSLGKDYVSRDFIKQLHYTWIIKDQNRKFSTPQHIPINWIFLKNPSK